MNRIIKFRVWNKEICCWYKKFYINESGFCFCGENSKQGYFPLPEQLCIQQFTGLQDKNGRDIYEGDIVYLYKQRYNTKWLDKKTVFVDGMNPKETLDVIYKKGYVKWLNGASGFVVDFSDNSLVEGLSDFEFKFEIIGNIFENKELLEKA